MPRKLAAKRLTLSDLTLFAYQYRNNSTVHQKSINLNIDVFIKELYPGLRDKSVTDDVRLPVDLFIYGPGLEGECNLQRKIWKSVGSKNWRLNGEFVENPEDSPQRFNALSANDFAIFDFSEGIKPESLKLILIAAAISEDRTIYQQLDQLLGRNSMIALSSTELEDVVNAAKPVSEHPVYGLTLDTEVLSSDVEDIALGGSPSRKRLASWTSSRKISRNDLQKAKESADLVGLRGEQYVNDYLLTIKTGGAISDFEWTSAKNAISSYDFWVVTDEEPKTLIDVKSTQGEFERTLHVSLNELLRMREGPERYDIYRVFNMKETTAQLRIAKNVGVWAKQILQVFEGLPEGISSDSISFSPTILPFGPSISLELKDQTEE